MPEKKLNLKIGIGLSILFFIESLMIFCPFFSSEEPLTVLFSVFFGFLFCGIIFAGSVFSSVFVLISYMSKKSTYLVFMILAYIIDVLSIFIFSFILSFSTITFQFIISLFILVDVALLIKSFMLTLGVYNEETKSQPVEIMDVEVKDIKEPIDEIEENKAIEIEINKDAE